MNFTLRTAFALGAAALALPLWAEVKLAGVFSDHMVLQRDRDLPVWGWADPGEEVTVSFAGQTASTKAAADGSWSVTLKPLTLNKEGAKLTVNGKNRIELNDVLVGDVWLCGGQSNMEMPFAWRVLDNDREIQDSARFPLIRQVKFDKINSSIPVADSRNSKWVVCSPQTLRNVTAAGYFFARAIHEKTGIPIGLLDDNWSGSRIEPFIAPEGFMMVPELKVADRHRNAALDSESGRKRYLAEIDKIKEWCEDAEEQVAEGKAPRTVMPQIPEVAGDGAVRYNAMIAPIVRFPIKGAIWYQGCSNGGDDDIYYHKMRALIEGWRKVWNQDFPFYFVQLASFQQVTDDPAGGNGWAKVREAQRKSLTIPNTGMAVTIDIGDDRDIHPKNKQDVGKRLALWALTHDYGVKDLVYSGPLYKEMKVEGDKIRIHFDHTGSGLMVGRKEGLQPTTEVKDGKLAQFAIAGADRKWYWADAVIDGDTVVVSSPEVKNPVAVRYAFRHNPKGCNLYNREGLPASPFRTDNW